MPSVDQVWATLPTAFKEKFPTTFTIIDGSEVLFIETPSDLHMQSSTWPQYKHHNTVKFLVACNPLLYNPCFCWVNIRCRINQVEWVFGKVRGQAWYLDHGRQRVHYLPD